MSAGTNTEILKNTDAEKKSSLDDIRKVASKIGLDENDLILYGTYKAKIRAEAIRAKRSTQEGKLILVTATTPTPFGEGKTTVSIGLSMALWEMGKRSVVALREPSLGPVFGIKGGATGGGRTMVQPMDEINLHFTGDFHAVTSAHNLLSALTDASIFHGNPLGIDTSRLNWPRTIDMNDRTLRRIIIGLDAHKSGPMREDSFVITPASEIMAILGLSRSFEDLKDRLGNILVGITKDKRGVYARDLHAEGSMTALLKDALMPNLAQTTDRTPAIIHTGPFGNIAHGTCSLTAIEAALSLSDYAVVEAGFGSDLGAEKFLNIVSPQLGRGPDATVLVTTVRSLKFHGGIPKTDLEKEDCDALTKGYENVRAHVNLMRNVFGLPIVVAINRFPKDTDREIETLSALLGRDGTRFAVSDGFSQGATGLTDVARNLLEVLGTEQNNYAPVYKKEDTLLEKIDSVAKKVYGAKGVEYSRKAMRSLDLYEKMGLGSLYICMAKTQYSLSDQPSMKGWPKDFLIRIDDVRVKSGAGFIVPLCGDILEMPGLPKEPAAWNIGTDENGVISGLF
jgi:formate--tetrahydrofolate ligase